MQAPTRLILRLLGWRIIGTPPDIPKYVLVGAPHTSNTDGFLMILVTTALRMRLNFLMKDSWFRGPLGAISRRLGGIPIDRSTSHNTVEQIVEAFKTHDTLALAITPEGTRRRTDHWRSGFYHIARQAGVPIVLAFADYTRKEVGFGPVITPTGDIKTDMDRIRAFYADKTGRFPENFGPVRLRNEEN
ncbi:MAG: lysophospholipid acyltransferase family protein [Anaerolineae bacterium]